MNKGLQLRKDECVWSPCPAGPAWQPSEKDMSANGSLESDARKLREGWEGRQGREKANKEVTDKQVTPVGHRHSILLWASQTPCT